MSVRSFHSVFMASIVAGAALSCYLVSLRVASERSALERVETKIALAQRDIRVLQTEIGTRARLSQLERWNVRVLSLSAPTADQILGDKFQLARMISPERKPALEAPVVLASAPIGEARPFVPQQADPAPRSAPAGELLRQASLKVEQPRAAPSRAAGDRPPDRIEPTAKGAAPAIARLVAAKPAVADKKAGDKPAKPGSAAMTKPVRTANADPLAPLAAEPSTAKGSLTNR